MCVSVCVCVRVELLGWEKGKRLDYFVYDACFSLHTCFLLQGDSGPVYDNASAIALNPVPAVQTHTDTHTSQQDDVHYDSVDFSRSKTQDVPLYSTIQSVQPQNQEKGVQYDTVRFNRPSPAPR